MERIKVYHPKYGIVDKNYFYLKSAVKEEDNTLIFLKKLLSKAIEKEDYFSAALIKKKIESMKKTFDAL